MSRGTLKKGLGISQKSNQFYASVATLAVLAVHQKQQAGRKLAFRDWVLNRCACSSIKFSFYGKGQDKIG